MRRGRLPAGNRTGVSCPRRGAFLFSADFRRDRYCVHHARQRLDRDAVATLKQGDYYILVLLDKGTSFISGPYALPLFVLIGVALLLLLRFLLSQIARLFASRLEQLFKF